MSIACYRRSDSSAWVKNGPGEKRTRDYMNGWNRQGWIKYRRRTWKSLALRLTGPWKSISGWFNVFILQMKNIGFFVKICLKVFYKGVYLFFLKIQPAFSQQLYCYVNSFHPIINRATYVNRSTLYSTKQTFVRRITLLPLSKCNSSNLVATD